MSDVITRFAPSPTGFLHIGGARTALFNWLYARHHGGRMLLRIEDTDRKRSTDEAVTAIFAGLEWLGIDWDGEPVRQHTRADRHREVAEKLLEAGHAYHCYATREELSQMRERARAEGRAASYDRRWRDRDPRDAPSGIAPSIRIKLPIEGRTTIPDLVQGEVSFANSDLEDFVILRSDGTATYMLAVVVDDHDMGVTHIIRGDDHLANAPKQALLYQTLDWQAPAMAHIPLIHGADGAKLSKRHGALGVGAYSAMGYLPAAMRNYLVRLGWSHGDDEFITTAEMTAWFDVASIGRGAARFDLTKLESMNAHYLRQTDDGELLDALDALKPDDANLAALHASLQGPLRDRFCTALPVLKERAKTLLDLLERGRFVFVERPMAIEPSAAGLLDDTSRELLGALLPGLERVQEWSAEAAEGAVRTFLDERGLKLGKVAQPLRAALTGRTSSPGIFDVLAILGQDESLARIADQTTTV